MAEYDELSYHELQDEAMSRDFPATGTTDELVERLEEDDDAPSDAGSDGASEQGSGTDDGDSEPQASAQGAPVTRQPSYEEDEDGLVGVSNDMRHRPGSHHFAARSDDGGGDDDEG